VRLGLDIRTILQTLNSGEVRFVVTGSVAALAYDVPVQPNDLDIAPDLTAENLERLAGVLADWGAKPEHDPNWPDSLSPEECAVWTPHPASPGRLDTVLETPHGRLDVVPWRSGWYLDLLQRATEREIEGVRVLVAHPDDLLATMRMNKEKHQVRRPLLEDARDRLMRIAGRR
jgi:hypothetical protein